MSYQPNEPDTVYHSGWCPKCEPGQLEHEGNGDEVTWGTYKCDHCGSRFEATAQDDSGQTAVDPDTQCEIPTPAQALLADVMLKLANVPPAPASGEYVEAYEERNWGWLRW